MENVIQKIEDIGIVPLLSLERIEYVDGVARCLIEGGIPCVEVAYRTEQAQHGIEYIKKNYPEILVGAGTVTNIEQAKSAVDAGASFLISPGFNEEIVSYAYKTNTAIIPGVLTPSEVQKALNRGINKVKLFPASIFGLNYINAIAAPFGEMKFMPTGGVKETNYTEYLENKHVFACSGSWLLPKELIRNKKDNELIQIISAAHEEVKRVRGV